MKEEGVMRKVGVLVAVLMFFSSLCFAQTEKGIIDTIAKRIEFSGELETGFKVESIGHKNRSGRVEDTEIQLTTAALAIEAEVTDWINVAVVPIFEVEEFYVDEGHVTLGPTESIPLYLKSGLMYYPFGKREEYTHFPDEPLVNLPFTMYFGEIWDPGAVVGFTKEIPGMGSLTLEGFAVYAKVTDSDNRQVDTYGFNVCYNLEKGDYKFEIGASYTNNALDSTGYKMYKTGLEDYERADFWTIHTERDIDAIATYGSIECGGCYLTAEYMGVVQPLKDEISRSGKLGARPRVWGVEVGTALENYLPLPKPVEVMFRYEGSLDAQEIYDIPRNRYAIGANIGLHEYLTWSLAYAYNDYNEGYGGGDPTGHETNSSLFFTQLGIKF